MYQRMCRINNEYKTPVLWKCSIKINAVDITALRISIRVKDI